jgi:hypothetical protein
MIIGPQVSQPQASQPLQSEQLPLDDILEQILPQALREGAPSGFAMTGHIGKWFD